MKKAIINAQIVLETGIIWDATLITEDDEILAYGKDIEIPPTAEIIDAEGAYVGPGLVDIHVHGGNGAHTAEDPITASEHFLKHGETTILATPSYNFTFERFINGIRTVRENLPKLRNVRGMYMEGPYTNSKYGSKTAQNDWVDKLTPEWYKPLVDEAGDLAKVWTVAPEREGITDFLAYARKVNPKVKIAIGHSHATPDMVRAMGSKFRPTILTHYGCANPVLPPLSGGTRGSGVDEYSLQNPDVYCEMISDSCAIHVQAPNQRLVVHAKGVEKVVLITDCTAHNNPNPEQFAHIDDLNFNQTGGLSGSKMTLDKACRNIMTHTNCGIAQAFIMASGNPAKAIGMYDEIGSIEPGKKADIIFVDDRFNVKKVMLRGEIVY
ncbi:MAG: amidohydrolase family protein [Clostridia bacterium]|nr:amidohydrolase family protein [Clostridia bacterium]